MPSFPYVKKGDAFQPNLELDNAVRRMVNAQNGFVSGKFSSKGNYGRISVCNTTSEVIEAGTAVSFPATADAIDGVIPCEKAKSATAQFGVITSDIAPDSIGSCIVSGPVTVEIGGTGDFAAPAEGGKMVAGASGAPILFRFANTAVINLGGGSGAAGASEYNGMHKLVLITDNSNPDAPIYKVCVCDGATYNPQTHTSGASSVIFSDRTFTLQSEIFTLEPKTLYVFVKVSLYECYYVMTDTIQRNDGTFRYYLIGTIYYKDKTFSLHQEHTTGTLKTGESDYSGMHKLVLITDDSNPEAPTYKVCVCDGATYDPKTHTSGASRVYVNGVAFDLKSEVFNVSNKYTSFYIVFTASTEDTEATVSYSTSGAYNDNQLTYSIGMFSLDNKAPYVLQQHTGNAVTLYWGVACDEFWK